MSSESKQEIKLELESQLELELKLEDKAGIKLKSPPIMIPSLNKVATKQASGEKANTKAIYATNDLKHVKHILAQNVKSATAIATDCTNVNLSYKYQAVLVGSRALAFHVPLFKPRKDSDWGIVATRQWVLNYLNECDKLNPAVYMVVNNNIASISISICDHCIMIAVDITDVDPRDSYIYHLLNWPAPEELLQTFIPPRQLVHVADLKMQKLLKLGYLEHWQDWQKHMDDYQLLHKIEPQWSGDIPIVSSSTSLSSSTASSTTILDLFRKDLNDYYGDESTDSDGNYTYATHEELHKLLDHKSICLKFNSDPDVQAIKEECQVLACDILADANNDIQSAYQDGVSSMFLSSRRKRDIVRSLVENYDSIKTLDRVDLPQLVREVVDEWYAKLEEEDAKYEEEAKEGLAARKRVIQDLKFDQLIEWFPLDYNTTNFLQHFRINAGSGVVIDFNVDCYSVRGSGRSCLWKSHFGLTVNGFRVDMVVDGFINNMLNGVHGAVRISYPKLVKDINEELAKLRGKPTYREVMEWFFNYIEPSFGNPENCGDAQLLSHLRNKGLISDKSHSMNEAFVAILKMCEANDWKEVDL